MDYTYELIREKISEHGKERIGYGITVRRGDKMLAEARDLSSNEEKVKQLIHLFNDLGLSYIHFMDCIEDMIDG